MRKRLLRLGIILLLLGIAGYLSSTLYNYQAQVFVFDVEGILNLSAIVLNWQLIWNFSVVLILGGLLSLSFGLEIRKFKAKSTHEQKIVVHIFQ